MFRKNFWTFYSKITTTIIVPLKLEFMPVQKVVNGQFEAVIDHTKISTLLRLQPLGKFGIISVI